MVICEGFGVGSAAFTAYTILPFVACSLFCFIALAFQYRKQVPRKLCRVALRDPRSVLQDPVGAWVGTFTLSATLVLCLIVTSFGIDAWMISLPFTFGKFLFDLGWDHYRYSRGIPMLGRGLPEELGEDTREPPENSLLSVSFSNDWKRPQSFSPDEESAVESHPGELFGDTRENMRGQSEDSPRCASSPGDVERSQPFPPYKPATVGSHPEEPPEDTKENMRESSDDSPGCASFPSDIQSQSFPPCKAVTVESHPEEALEDTREDTSQPSEDSPPRFSFSSGMGRSQPSPPPKATTVEPHPDEPLEDTWEDTKKPLEDNPRCASFPGDVQSQSFPSCEAATVESRSEEVLEDTSQPSEDSPPRFSFSSDLGRSQPSRPCKVTTVEPHPDEPLEDTMEDRKKSLEDSSRCAFFPGDVQSQSFPSCEVATVESHSEEILEDTSEPSEDSPPRFSFSSDLSRSQPYRVTTVGPHPEEHLEDIRKNTKKPSESSSRCASCPSDIERSQSFPPCKAAVVKSHPEEALQDTREAMRVPLEDRPPCGSFPSDNQRLQPFPLCKAAAVESHPENPKFDSKTNPRLPFPLMTETKMPGFSGQMNSQRNDLNQRFPTFMTALPRLPFDLVPFAFSQFILIEALNHQGWVNIFANWLVRASHGQVHSTIWLIGVISIILCNLSATNIGVTILLTKIVRAASLPYDANRAAAIALAVASNIGAVNFTFSASLVGLLWRAILGQKGIHVRQRDFASWNLLPLLVMTAVGLGIVSVEMAVLFPPN